MAISIHVIQMSSSSDHMGQTGENTHRCIAFPAQPRDQYTGPISQHGLLTIWYHRGRAVLHAKKSSSVLQQINVLLLTNVRIGVLLASQLVLCLFQDRSQCPWIVHISTCNI